MRKKLDPENKRTVIIGIKTKEITKKRIKSISEREGKAMSTQINIILENYIEQYLIDNKLTYKDIDIEEEGN